MCSLFRWQFKTEGHDIKFGILATDSENIQTVMVPVKKVSCHEFEEIGVIKCKYPGECNYFSFYYERTTRCSVVNRCSSHRTRDDATYENDPILLFWLDKKKKNMFWYNIFQHASISLNESRESVTLCNMYVSWRVPIDTVVFDNSYSFMRSKKLAYSIRIALPVKEKTINTIDQMVNVEEWIRREFKTVKKQSVKLVHIFIIIFLFLSWFLLLLFCFFFLYSY